MSIGYMKLHPDAKFTKGSVGAAGCDLYAVEDGVVFRGQTLKVPTGIALVIPEGFFGLIRDRSSVGSKGVIISAGVIDSDYRGEILLCMNNLNPEPWEFKKGDRIGQMIIIPYFMQSPTLIEELPKTDRGTGGFGSTGK